MTTATQTTFGYTLETDTEYFARQSHQDRGMDALRDRLTREYPDSRQTSHASPADPEATQEGDVQASEVSDGITVGAESFSIAKHDGTVTLVSPRTGDHRTFRIRTVKRGKWAGWRLVELLIGSDNTSDYRAFGALATAGNKTGEIWVWNRFKNESPVYEKYADMLSRPAYWSSRGVQYLASLRCKMCGRTLTRPESISSGYGPECIKKVMG